LLANIPVDLCEEKQKTEDVNEKQQERYGTFRA
jgi:hypothetical protein